MHAGGALALGYATANTTVVAVVVIVVALAAIAYVVQRLWRR
jgi:hypothetical protein